MGIGRHRGAVADTGLKDATDFGNLLPSTTSTRCTTPQSSKTKTPSSYPIPRALPLAEGISSNDVLPRISTCYRLVYKPYPTSERFLAQTMIGLGGERGYGYRGAGG